MAFAKCSKNDAYTRKIDNVVLKSFWQLAETSDEKRIKAAQIVLKRLQETQCEKQVLSLFL